MLCCRSGAVDGGLVGGLQVEHGPSRQQILLIRFVHFSCPSLAHSWFGVSRFSPMLVLRTHSRRSLGQAIGRLAEDRCLSNTREEALPPHPGGSAAAAYHIFVVGDHRSGGVGIFREWVLIGGVTVGHFCRSNHTVLDILHHRPP